MQTSEDLPASELDGAIRFEPRLRRAAMKQADRPAGNARTAPRGHHSRIGDDETHRRLQDARNRARHSTEDMIRRALGPEWARE